WIKDLFAPPQVRSLTRDQATKKAVVVELRRQPGWRIVHFAAHGLVHQEFGNRFGAIALTPPPPGKGTPEDDGFLSLHEICNLPLQGCELAVLSACWTNVGPLPPLEAGGTLASGFLSAGAPRGVARP